MCQKSPSNLLRSIKRITRFSDIKSRIFHLSNHILSQIDISPEPRILSFSTPIITSVSPKEKSLSFSVPIVTEIHTIKKPRCPRSENLSYQKFQPVEVVPGSRNNDNILFSLYIDGGTFSTIFVCHFCYDDHSFKSANFLRTHVETIHRNEMHHKLKTALSPCPVLKR